MKNFHERQSPGLGCHRHLGIAAALAVAVTHVPPFLLTGLALLTGSLIALPLSRFDFRQWLVPRKTLAIGVFGLLG